MKAGYGERIVNPSSEVELSGYGYYLERKAKEILDDLKVRALGMEEKGEKLILISCDILSLSTEFADEIRREISENENIPIENILISTIHTHTGPAGQNMRGCGELNLEYCNQLKNKIGEAVEDAIKEQAEAEAFYFFEAIEPIGFNRRNGNFYPIDPLLKVIVFQRANRKIYLFNYTCHPVTLGIIDRASACWPGRVVKEIEKGGNDGIFFQGFCGDIDPVTNLNRWGKGTEEDIDLYGKLVYGRILKGERYSKKILHPVLKSAEKRIKLPLKVPGIEEIEKETQDWIKSTEESENEGMKKFILDWEKEAKEKHEYFFKNPYIDDVPIQVISIGELKMVGLPGEVFCEYDLNLRKKFPVLLTIGYANGCVGYLPVENAYKKENDYACYLAPKIFDLFPFRTEVEEIILKETTDLLFQIEGK